MAKIDNGILPAYSISMSNIINAILYSPEFADFLFNNLGSAIFLVDNDLRVMQINAPFKSLFSATDESALNQLCGNVLGCEFAVNQGKPCGETSECGTCAIRSELLKSFEQPDEIRETRVSRNFIVNGTSIPKQLQITSRHAMYEGKPVVVAAIHDVTELEEQKKKIEDMSNFDYLTGLANRHYFLELAGNLYQNAKRGNISISVAMFDIDSLNKINETSGHPAGDLVLKEVADIMVTNLRKADIVARFGGGEFCILLHCKEPADSYTVIDKLRLFVELHPFIYEGKKIDVTISAGLTSVLGDSLDDMVRKADEMLHKAKANGRNRTEEFA